jgi:hypothetical protein
MLRLREICLLLAKCFVAASMKRVKYDVYIHLCQNAGEIFYTKCSCKAGAGGCCKHVAATLYQLVDYKELDIVVIPDDKACTDVLQQWHDPGELNNSEAILFSDLTFEKADAYKDQFSTRKRPLVSGRREFCSLPRDITSSEGKIKSLCDSLEQLGEGSYMSTILKGNDYKPSNFFKTSVTESLERAQPIQKKIVTPREPLNFMFENFDKEADVSRLTGEQKNFVSQHLSTPLNNIIAIETSTIMQSESDLWYTERGKRLTASNFGSVLNRRKSIFPQSLLKKLLPQSQNRNYVGESCRWGKVNEPKAIKQYEVQKSLKVISCGFVINPK